MAETLAQYFVDFLQNKIPNELIVFIVSLFPILELRGGMIRGEAPGCSVYHGVSYFVYRQYGADSFHFAIYQKDICLAAPLSPLGKNH